MMENKTRSCTENKTEKNDKIPEWKLKGFNDETEYREHVIRNGFSRYLKSQGMVWKKVDRMNINRPILTKYEKSINNGR